MDKLFHSIFEPRYMVFPIAVFIINLAIFLELFLKVELKNYETDNVVFQSFAVFVTLIFSHLFFGVLRLEIVTFLGAVLFLVCAVVIEISVKSDESFDMDLRSWKENSSTSSVQELLIMNERKI